MCVDRTVVCTTWHATNNTQGGSGGGDYLKDNGLIVLVEVEGEHVGIHEGLATLAQHVDCLAQELYLYPGHVLLLHGFHLILDVVHQL